MENMKLKKVGTGPSSPRVLFNYCLWTSGNWGEQLLDLFSQSAFSFLGHGAPNSIISMNTVPFCLCCEETVLLKKRIWKASDWKNVLFSYVQDLLWGCFGYQMITNYFDDWMELEFLFFTVFPSVRPLLQLPHQHLK